MKKGKCASCEEEEKSWKLKFKRNSSQEIFSTHQREKRGVCDVLKKKRGGSRQSVENCTEKSEKPFTGNIRQTEKFKKNVRK